MALPRSRYVKLEQEGVYHCFSRCVRRAFLCGFDMLTQRDFSHRKAWLVDRLRHLASIFAVEVCAYAVMDNHYHTILRTRPDIVARWSDPEVATRWLTLFPRHRNPGGIPLPPADIDIRALLDSPLRIAQLRQRLSSLSWFMAKLNEFIARAANKEDNVKGRFWESRFKCQALLDFASIAACMVYVDLNPIRAGLANSPENSNFTSIQQRFRAWQSEIISTPPYVSLQPAQIQPSTPEIKFAPVTPITDNSAFLTPNPLPSPTTPSTAGELSPCWLCPIQSDHEKQGILEITSADYLELVSSSARLILTQKQTPIQDDLARILLRIGASQQNWPHTISHFGSMFSFAAGLLPNLRSFADRLGQRWFRGVVASRIAFRSSRTQLA